MRTVKFFLLLVLSCCLGTGAHAQRIYVEGIQYEVVSETPAEAQLTSARRCMASFTIPSTVGYEGKEYAVKYLGYNAFYAVNCVYHLFLTDVEDIDDGYSTYYEDNGSTKYTGCFAHCTGILTMDCPKVKKVGDFSFHECSALSEIALPSVETIGKYAFQECTALETVVLGAHTRKLGAHCFAKANRIARVRVEAAAPPVCLEAPFEEGVYQQATLQVPAGTMADYARAEGWKHFKVIEEFAPTALEEMATEGQRTLRVAGATVRMEGFPAGTSVAVYDTAGKRVASLRTDGMAVTLRLAPRQRYLIQAGGAAYKVAL